MATPNYQGRGQPVVDSGGWFGTWLGGTPAYTGAGQPSSRSSAYGSAAPAYKPAPTTASSQAAMTSVDPAGVCPGPFEIVVIPREAIAQQ